MDLSTHNLVWGYSKKELSNIIRYGGICIDVQKILLFFTSHDKRDYQVVLSLWMSLYYSIREFYLRYSVITIVFVRCKGGKLFELLNLAHNMGYS